MLKTILQHNAVLLCKNGYKKHLIFEKSEHFKKMQENGHQAKAIAFAKSSFEVEN